MYKAVINGESYDVDVQLIDGYCYVYNIVSDDDVDFLGRFLLRDNKLIEYFIMSGEEVVIGELHEEK